VHIKGGSMLKKAIIINISIILIGSIILAIPHIPRGNSFNASKDIIRIILFDATTSRTTYSFTLNRDNVLSIDSGLRRIITIRRFRTLGIDSDGRLNLVRRGIFIENTRNTVEIILSDDEMYRFLNLLNYLDFDKPPQIGLHEDFRLGDGGQRWGALIYFNGRYYETILNDRLPTIEPLRDVVDKVVLLSEVTINLPSR